MIDEILEHLENRLHRGEITEEQWREELRRLDEEW